MCVANIKTQMPPSTDLNALELLHFVKRVNDVALRQVLINELTIVSRSHQRARPVPLES